MSATVCIVGAGFSGAVIARELADNGIRSVVIDERDHIAGNCHTERDLETGVNVHRYGPHIFHTDSERVWKYVNRFGEIKPYANKVKTTHQGKVYSLPINLHTLNQFFGRDMHPEEARAFLNSKAEKAAREPISFEEQALSTIGRELYEAFFEGYSRKQWGMDPADLPASVFKRLPVRFTYDDNYYFHKYQGMPENGYTEIVRRMLDHPLIQLRLGEKFEKGSGNFGHVFYSGPIDRYFDHRLGRLGYRSLRFEAEVSEGDYQGTAVMNYGDYEVPYTRITEHKHFAPWEEHEKTIIFREYAYQCGEGDIPYYPIRQVEEKLLFTAYKELADAETGVTFVGRLGTYRYLDMDVTILEALETADQFLAGRKM